MEEHVSQKTLAPLSTPVAIGGKVRLENFPLDNKTETLELERFEVFADNADIKVFGANRQILETLPKPDITFYRGRLASDRDSLIFISLSPGRVDGLVYKGERRFSFISRPHAKREAATVDGGFDVFIDDTSAYEESTDAQGFVCELDQKPMVGRPRMAELTNGLPAEPQVDGAINGNGKWLLNVAIDTDFELYTNVSSSASNVTTYIGNLIGAASAIYSRDLSTDLQISYLGIQSTSTDPFTVVPGESGTWNGDPATFSTAHALAEYGDYWHNTPPSAAPRASSVLISGKSQFAGVAWISTICTSDFFCNNGNCGDSLWNGHYGGKYAYCGGIFPPVGLAVGQNTTAPYTVPSSNYWPLLEFTHEFGHNVQSGHTHCIALSAADQLAYGRAFVDNCYSGQGGCFIGIPSVPVEKGTIMSYCHLRPGGAPNSRYTFGQSGEASHVVPENMRNAISNKTPAQPTIAAPGSMASGGSANATISPVGGVTYLWQVTNGVINTGQGTTTLNFTATTNPVTVKLTETNATGCAITNFVTIPVTTGPKRGDANGDGVADIFWHRDNGENFLWLLDNTGHLASPLGLPTLPASWSVAATGDYNGDGKTDFFLRDQAAGQNYMWLLDSNNIIGLGPLPPVDSNWSVAGSGDFDGDHRSDILWRRTTGEDYVWLLNGTTLASNGPIHTVDPTWTLRVGGDITGDGKADILLRQNTTGINYLWTMNGINVVAAANLPTVDTNWDIAALVDLNGDAKSDIFWRRNTGDNYVWLLDGAILASNAPLPPISDTNWRVVGWGDFDGDGDGDIFWRNVVTGETYLWRMNGTTLAIPQPLYTIETSWKIVGPR